MVPIYHPCAGRVTVEQDCGKGDSTPICLTLYLSNYEITTGDGLEQVLGVGSLRVGGKVVFAKDKMSDSPGKRAKEVVPLRAGEDYSYIVEKYWTVKAVHHDGTATLITRRGKEHRVALDDPRLRHASLWERCFYGKRFPRIEPPPSASPPSRTDDPPT